MAFLPINDGVKFQIGGLEPVKLFTFARF